MEGSKILDEAMRGDAAVLDVFVAPDADDRVVEQAVGRGARRHDLAQGVLERVADTVTPQPVAPLPICRLA